VSTFYLLQDGSVLDQTLKNKYFFILVILMLIVTTMNV